VKIAKSAALQFQQSREKVLLRNCIKVTGLREAELCRPKYEV